jgi:hypothetical protein
VGGIATGVGEPWLDGAVAGFVLRTTFWVELPSPRSFSDTSTSMTNGPAALLPA